MTPLEEARWTQAHPEAILMPTDGDPAFYVTVATDADGRRIALHKPHEHCAEAEPHADCLLGLSEPFRAAILAHRATPSASD